MRRAGQALCALTVAAAIAWVCVHWDASRLGADALYGVSEKPSAALAPVPTIAFAINAGSVDALCELRGVGPALAEAILAEREAHGDFYYPEDLTAVKGIGAKTLRKMRSQLMGE